MQKFFWFCFAFLIPGMLLRIPVGGAGILVTDLLLPIFAGVWIFYKVTTHEPFPKNDFLLPGFLFLLFAFFSFLWGAWELPWVDKLLAFAYVLRFGSILVFGLVAQDFYRTNKLFDKFFIFFFWIAFVVIVLGFLQFYLVPNISDWSTEGGLDPHEGRMLGTWLDPNFFAGFLGFLLPVVLGYRATDISQRKKIFLYIFSGIIFVALFLTFSRSGYLATIAGLFVFFFFRNPKIILLGILFALLGLATNQRAQERVEELAGTFSAILFENTDEIDPTAGLRLESWTNTYNLWKKYPFGIGYNTYRYRASEEGIVDENYFSSGGSDSTLLTILVTTGLAGLFLFLFFFGKVTLLSFFRYRATGNPLFLGFCGGMVALFIHSFFVNSLLFPFIFLPWIAVAGVLENISKNRTA